MNKIIPDYEKKKKLNESIFFVRLFHYNERINSESDKMEEYNFANTEKVFKNLKILFEDNWISKLDEEIINECYKSIIEMKKKEIKKELNFIKEYYNLQGIQDNQIDKIAKDLIIYSKREEIFSIVNSCLYFIKGLESDETEFSSNLESIKEDIKNNISIEKIDEYCKYLENKEIVVLNPKNEDKDFINILKMLYNINGSLELIISLKEEDCRNLQEIVFDIDNCFITSVEIQAMSQCSNFIRGLNIIKNDTSDFDAIIKFKKAILNSKNIAPYFVIYTRNYTQIKDLLEQKLDKTQATRKIIKNISKKSHFCLSICNDKEEYYSFSDIIFEEENKNENNKEVEGKVNFVEKKLLL